MSGEEEEEEEEEVAIFGQDRNGLVHSHAEGHQTAETRFEREGASEERRK